MLEVIILAVLQGVAEFLPISSSGHLVIAQNLLNVNEPGMRLDVFLHLGTLFAIVAFYWRFVARLLKFDMWALLYLGKLCLSAIPAIVVCFVFKHQIAYMFEDSRIVGSLLICTGIVVSVTRFLPQGRKDVTHLRAVLIGIAQSIALLPGISRSGMTLACARASKVDNTKAAEFSFLMSAPLIVGGVILELARSAGGVETGRIGWGLTIFGAAVSAVVGYFSLALLVRSLKSSRFWLFGVYCIIAGTATVLFL